MHETGGFLAEDTRGHIDFVPPHTQPPGYLSYLFQNETKARGTYPGAFDYEFARVPECDNSHLWAFLFWERIIFVVWFSDPCPAT